MGLPDDLLQQAAHRLGLICVVIAGLWIAGLAPGQLQQVLVTEYDVGAAIGWHRDKAVFGDVIGISLLSACRFRLRRKAGTKWERA